MRIALFVHDFYLQVGKSRTLIEIIKRLPVNQIEEVKIVSFGKVTRMRVPRNFEGKVTYTRVLGSRLYPPLIKMMFYHIWTFFYVHLFMKDKYTKISIGLAAPVCDYVYVHTIHKQWEEMIWRYRKFPALLKLYKMVMYRYLSACEDIIYRNKEKKFFAIAGFIKKYLKESYGVAEENICLLYPSVDIDQFKISNVSKQDRFDLLLERHPELSKLNVRKPVMLFIGGFARKGLFNVLDSLGNRKDENFQIIAIGDSIGTEIHHLIPKNVKLVHLQISSNLVPFFELCDAFILSNWYGPFDLVVMEALVMGLQIYITSGKVGAVEVIDGLSEVYVNSSPEHFPLKQLRIMTREEKESIRRERLYVMGDYSWEDAAKTTWGFINS